MTSRLRRNSDKGPSPSSEPAEKLHFFKIILSAALRDGKIGIPKKFVCRFGKNLSDTMFLKVPDGAVWKLGLVRGEDGEVWLQRGWRAFAEHYSLDHGHFLVFRYERDSVFRVLIFDTTACEIEYPSSTHDQHQDPVDKIGGIVPVTVEIPRADTGKSDVVLPPIRNAYPKAEARPPPLRQPATKRSHCNCPRKADEKIMTSGGATGLKFVKIETGVDSEKAGPNRAGHNHLTSESCRRRMTSPALPPSTSGEVVVGALERAMAFKPVNPFFLLKMGPAYISKSYANMPKWFAKAYMKKTKNESVKVRGCDGRTWSMKYRLRGRVTYGQDVAHLSSGWKIFVRDNQLKLGDVCVFELLKSPPILLKVFIFRNNHKILEKAKVENGERGNLSPPLPVLDEERRQGNVSCNNDQGTGIMDEKAGSQATDDDDDDQCTIITGFNHHQIEDETSDHQGIIHIDSDTCSSDHELSMDTHSQRSSHDHLGHHESITKEDPRQRMNETKLVSGRMKTDHRSDASKWKSDGFLPTIRNTNPEAETRPPLLKKRSHRNSPRKAHQIITSGWATGLKFVKLEAGVDSEKSGPNRGERLGAGHDYHTGESRRRGMMSAALPPLNSSKEVLGALERAMAFKPANPVFLLKMGPAYLAKAHAHIPMLFAKAYLKRQNQSVKVKGSDGRTWWIYLQRRVTCGYETAEFCSGWRIFVRDNQLKLGDVCAFELLNSTPILLKLFIFRKSSEDHHQ